MSIWGPLENRYSSTKQRKILSLDGGGIRGVISLEILLELEKQLKKELKQDDNFTLSSYYDYIGGTSTGAIIAAGLSLGLSVQKLLDFYIQNGKAMFDKAFFLNKINFLYNEQPLLKKLKETFGEEEIDLRCGKFKTLLMVVIMNRTTDSPWPISNNPLAKYADTDRPDSNLKIPLYRLVRASTAAPAYFKSETVEWERNNPQKKFGFVDGGVTPYNNPAFLLYRMATQEAYKLNWKTGERTLLITSIGTGSASSPGVYNNIFKTLFKLPGNLMHAMQVDQDISCRTVGRCIYGSPIDKELGDMLPLDEEGKPLNMDSDANRHFSYVRYNADLSPLGLQHLNLSHISSKEICKMDSVKNIQLLQQVGIAASKQVNVKQHFNHFIDNGV
ncbi:patatin [Flavobacterium sp. Sd200]|uniref:patatin-like phospholipase family protein n=1 Tax=Flavobacterium sp. Sd200 TaxID=2692211 RepID=UPI001368F6AD|nr:patatin-like phospholipase family protein [Flavobacterium sp. Sd200]MXN92316.1 patatin [Flavobacterium sp. Sd200]